jgi:hypothetical protein
MTDHEKVLRDYAGWLRQWALVSDSNIQMLNELAAADAIDAVLAEIAEASRIAGEAVETDPSLRSLACVSALATYAQMLEQEVAQLRRAMEGCDDCEEALAVELANATHLGEKKGL